jgi:hypothetical protein
MFVSIEHLLGDHASNRQSRGSSWRRRVEHVEHRQDCRKKKIMHKRPIVQHGLGTRYAERNSEFWNSPTPERQWLPSTLHKPRKANISAVSRKLKENLKYPSRAKPNTALGPTVTSPLIIGVK